LQLQFRMNDRTYTSEFFDSVDQGSLASAHAVVPHVNALVRPRSVVDVGCGRGAWLRVWREFGVQDILGIDGPDVETDKLHIPAEKFTVHDLEQPFEVGRRFDLAMSLETAEHLSADVAASFVKFLTTLADVVLFSAAIPFQSGTHHVNEQWPEYWVAMFCTHGFVAVDCLRPLIWKKKDVKVWYAQNMLLFVKSERLLSDPELAAKAAYRSDMLDVVHPRLYVEMAEALNWTAGRVSFMNESPRALLKALPHAVSHAISKTLRNLRKHRSR
jgi:SAM-dependent methyltransferase